MFKIGHYTDLENITGCSVILLPPKTIGSCYVAGSAPGTREVELLHPERKIENINAVLLTGGSAFGLSAAQGVVQFLEEQGIGYKTNYGIVPLVTAAVIFDLNIGNNKIRPSAKNAYQACKEANESKWKEGNIGAGTGATVGKWAGIQSAMKSGLGVAELKHKGVFVKALSVVNAVGDIIDENGQIIAGAINNQKEFIAKNNRQIRWQPPEVGLNENTVLSVILTNAKIDKLQAFIISKKAANGFARSIIPSNTNYDGDVIFTFSIGDSDMSFDVLIEMATEAVRQSIVSGARSATSLGNIIGYKDL